MNLLIRCEMWVAVIWIRLAAAVECFSIRLIYVVSCQIWDHLVLMVDDHLEFHPTLDSIHSDRLAQTIEWVLIMINFGHPADSMICSCNYIIV